MLAIHPHPPHLHHSDAHHCRGRSRQVSHAALARQASEERRSGPIRVVHRRLYPRPALNLSAERNLSLPSLPYYTDEKVGFPSTFQAGTLPLQPSTTIFDESQSIHNPTRPTGAMLNPEPVAPPPVIAPKPMRAETLPVFLRSDSSLPNSSLHLTTDYYDSPPSPPRSLEDQVHVAYALDNIHLAKILLLKLKGVEITSDDDPRIEAVKDEDFDFCFVPNGRLLDDREEKEMEEQQRKELRKQAERRRMERLKACGHKWEDAKRQMRDLQLEALCKREALRIAEEERRKVVREAEKARIAAEKRRREEIEKREREKRRLYSGVPRLLGRTHKQVDMHSNNRGPTPGGSRGEMYSDQPFVYDFMPTTCNPRKAKPHAAQSISHSRPLIPVSISFRNSHSIPFTDVLDSMHGPLFPVTNEERIQRTSSPDIHAKSTSKTHSQAKRRREIELFQSLLEFVDTTVEDKRGKGKGNKAVQSRDSHICAACNAQTSLLSSRTTSFDASSSASTSTRSNGSWLSFRHSSSSLSSATSTSSASTDITTPSTSPPSSSPITSSSWFKPTSFTNRSSTLQPSPRSQVSSPQLRHSCMSYTRYTLASATEGPLSLAPITVKDEILRNTTLHSVVPRTSRRSSSSNSAKQRASLLVRQLSRFVDLAKGFQNVYMNAALFSVGVAYDSYDVVGSRREDVQVGVVDGSRRVSGSGKKTQLRPAGQRVTAHDIAIFLNKTCPQPLSSSTSSSSVESDSDSDDESSAKYIAMTSPYPPAQPPRTVLPNPLPFKIVFKPIPIPSRSPSRVAQTQILTTYPRYQLPPTSSCYDEFHGRHTGARYRVVQNPVFLRLKALNNVINQQGIKWEGYARETALGGGRERFVRATIEGTGRSSLRCSS